MAGHRPGRPWQPTYVAHRQAPVPVAHILAREHPLPADRVELDRLLDDLERARGAEQRVCSPTATTSPSGWSRRAAGASTRRDRDGLNPRSGGPGAGESGEADRNLHRFDRPEIDRVLPPSVVLSGPPPPRLITWKWARWTWIGWCTSGTDLHPAAARATTAVSQTVASDGGNRKRLPSAIEEGVAVAYVGWGRISLPWRGLFHAR